MIGILVETPGDFVVLILVEIGNRNPDRILAEIKAGFLIMILGEMSTGESDLNLTEITIIK